MPLKTTTFTALSADAIDGSLAFGGSFSLASAPDVLVTVSDDDDRLSGDFFDHPTDGSGQTAAILVNGEEVGSGGAIYGESIFKLLGSDGHIYHLLEIEQEGSDTEVYTFVGDLPPEGASFTVLARFNTGSVQYDKLGAGEAPVEPENIVDIAAGNPDFEILVRALDAAGLVDAVREAGDITVFAPTDAAFGQLAVDLGFEGDPADENAVFDFIVAALTDLGEGDPIPLLTDILLYHVSPGAQSAEEIDAAESIVTLLEGATFGTEGTELVDNEPDIDNPNIVIPDIPAENGTIQAIDRVLLPLDIPGNEPEPQPEQTLTGLVAASGGVFDDDAADFDLLFNALQAAGLTDALDDPDAELTVFAPNDAAFVSLAQTLGFEGTDEGEAFVYLVDALELLSGGDAIGLLTEILTYHVAPGELDSTAVLSAESIETLQGGTLGVDGTSLVDADPDVPDPMLIATDLEASNGIAHVLDGVLLPVDVLQSDGSDKVDFIIGDDGASVVHTGRDNDLVSGKGGNDAIFLGRGDDLALGGDGHDLIGGGRGDDTIDGGAGDDLLRGGKDDDTVSGGDGDDIIVGGRGSDLMTGGAGADTFVLRRNDGEDVITDFASGEDSLNLRHLGFHDFHDVLASATEDDGDLVIETGAGSVRLEDFALADLNSADVLV